MFRRILMGAAIVTLAAGGTTACATKKFVRTSVGQVNDKVDSLGRSVEETQERTRKNEAKISDVDQRAQAAAAAAAKAAQDASAQANTANGAATSAANTARTASARVEEVDKAAKRLLYEVTISEDQGNFKFGKTELPDEAKAKIDELANKLKADPKGAFLEIEGHTDNLGGKVINEKIGLERAEAVKRYLYEEHKIPLHKMNVISYGDAKPVAPNKTKIGRAQNRRVVIKVLT
jgi:peptidoglycan-associated lipoprotein